MSNLVQIKIVDYNSDLQKKSIDLRYKTLREPLGLQYTKEQLLTEKNDIHIVAIKNNKIIGVLLLRIVDALTIQMRQVAVDFLEQKSGIGKELVKFSEQYAKHHCYKKIILQARETAKEFYLKFNYSIVGDVFEEVGIPHLFMEKKIN